MRVHARTIARPNQVTRVRQRDRFNAFKLVRERCLLVLRALLQRGQRVSRRPFAARSLLLANRRFGQRLVINPATLRRVA